MATNEKLKENLSKKEELTYKKKEELDSKLQ